MEVLERAELERFRTIVGERLRLQFDNGKVEFLADALRQRLNARRMGAGAYLAELGSGNAREELRALASQLTVTETYFFRTPDHFGALARVALPERIRDAATHRRLRLLSAGCASGEEPYSLAMRLREQFPEVAGWDIKILGLDINPAMLAKLARPVTPLGPFARRRRKSATNISPRKPKALCSIRVCGRWSRLTNATSP